MDRREVLRWLATGAALQFAPHRLLAVTGEARALLHSQISPRTLNAHQEATVKAMAEIIIPRTDTPGATDVGVVAFIDLLLTEWCQEKERTQFLTGLDQVDEGTRSLFGKDFIDCSTNQQSETLMVLGEKTLQETPQRGHQLDDDDEVLPAKVSPEAAFYSMLRRFTLTAYYTSEAGATEELHFEIIPDHYQGCDDAPSTKEALKQQ